MWWLETSFSFPLSLSLIVVVIVLIREKFDEAEEEEGGRHLPPRQHPDIAPERNINISQHESTATIEERGRPPSTLTASYPVPT